VTRARPGDDRPDDDLPVFDEAFVAGARYVEEPAHLRTARTAGTARAGRGRRLALAAGALGLVGVAAVVAPGLGAGSPGTGRASAGTSGPVRTDGPPQTPPESPERLLPAPALPQGGRDHAFFAETADGSPVAWSPCRSIRFVVRTEGEPDGGRAMLDQALRRVTAATGLSFVDAGTTSEGPAEERSAYQPRRYGDRWAPVLVAWSDPVETPQLAGDTAGYAGPASAAWPGEPEQNVSGQVVLDVPQLAGLGREQARSVVMHELAHLVGLDHVDAPRQLMHPTGDDRSPTEFADGDRRGLAELGRGPCL